MVVTINNREDIINPINYKGILTIQIAKSILVSLVETEEGIVFVSKVILKVNPFVNAVFSVVNGLIAEENDNFVSIVCNEFVFEDVEFLILKPAPSVTIPEKNVGFAFDYLHLWDVSKKKETKLSDEELSEWCGYLTPSFFTHKIEKLKGKRFGIPTLVCEEVAQ